MIGYMYVFFIIYFWEKEKNMNWAFFDGFALRTEKKIVQLIDKWLKKRRFLSTNLVVVRVRGRVFVIPRQAETEENTVDVGVDDSCQISGRYIPYDDLRKGSS